MSSLRAGRRQVRRSTRVIMCVNCDNHNGSARLVFLCPALGYARCDILGFRKDLLQHVLWHTVASLRLLSWAHQLGYFYTNLICVASREFSSSSLRFALAFVAALWTELLKGPHDARAIAAIVVIYAFLIVALGASLPVKVAPKAGSMRIIFSQLPVWPAVPSSEYLILNTQSFGQQ